MKVQATGRIGGDESQRYIVSEWQASTVAELVDEIIREHPHEWGSINVKSCGHWVLNEIEYKNGSVVSGSLDKRVRDLRIRKVQANGGWSNMDYWITPCYDSDGWMDGDVLVLTDGRPLLLADRDEDRAVVYGFLEGKMTEYQCIFFPDSLFGGNRIERLANENEKKAFFDELRKEGYTYMPQFKKVIRAKVLK